MFHNTACYLIENSWPSAYCRSGVLKLFRHRPRLSSELITCILSIALLLYNFFFNSRPLPQWARASSLTGFLDHTQQLTTVGRTPLDECSAHRRDLYLTTHNTHNRQTDRHAPGRIRTHNLSRRAAANLRLRPRGHWDRLSVR